MKHQILATWLFTCFLLWSSQAIVNAEETTTSQEQRPVALENKLEGEQTDSTKMELFQKQIDLLQSQLDEMKESKQQADPEQDESDMDEALDDTSPDPRAQDGFSFGTYGRIQGSFNKDKQPGKSSNVVSHGSRLMEGPYLELDFKYSIHTDDGFGVKVLATLAFFEEFFHFNADTYQAIGIRNLYAMAENIIPDVNLKLWVGSRMYRGDDIYLLDFWPLDNLNTIGGGVQWDGYNLRLKAHVGVNRLMNSYQFNSIEVPSAYGSDEMVIMDRQRIISSFKATYFLHKFANDLSMKFSLYGEYHHLPSGNYRYSDEDAEYFEQYGLKITPGTDMEQPKDSGGVVGAQIGLWGFAENAHLNLFVRYAWDLAAYGEWGVPFGVNLDRTAKGAKELVTALSFNWESYWVGMMAGWYGRYFEDADQNTYDFDDYWEGITVVRPAIFVTRHFHQLFEISHQWKYPHGLGPNEDTHLIPQVWQMSVIPTLSLDKGMYKRPQFRLVYTASYLNYAARNLYPTFDKRRDEAWQHYIGLQVEWWLDSASYE